MGHGKTLSLPETNGEYLKHWGLEHVKMSCEIFQTASSQMLLLLEEICTS